MPAELQENNIYPGKILGILTGILLVMFPVGFIIMLTGFGTAYLWTTTLFLGLEALITFIILVKSADLLSVVITTAVIFMGSWFIEYWGVNTGFPFGSYSYTHVLSPLIGGVPLAISFAWFTVTANSLLAARYLANGSSELTAVIIGSVFVLATDILLEPFASFINNFWVWQTSAIPVQNFISWYVIGFIFLATVSLLIKWNDNQNVSSRIYKIPVLITAVNVANFSVINIVSGYLFLTITGLVIFAAIVLSVKFFKTAAIS